MTLGRLVLEWGIAPLHQGEDAQAQQDWGQTLPSTLGSLGLSREWLGARDNGWRSCPGQAFPGPEGQTKELGGESLKVQGLKGNTNNGKDHLRAPSVCGQCSPIISKPKP